LSGAIGEEDKEYGKLIAPDKDQAHSVRYNWSWSGAVGKNRLSFPLPL